MKSKQVNQSQGQKTDRLASNELHRSLPNIAQLDSQFMETLLLPVEICPCGKSKVMRVSHFARSGFVAISVEDIIYNVVIPRRFKKKRRVNRVKVENLVLASRVFETKKAILKYIYSPTEIKILEKYYFNFTSNQKLFVNDF